MWEGHLAQIEWLILLFFRENLFGQLYRFNLVREVVEINCSRTVAQEVDILDANLEKLSDIGGLSSTEGLVAVINLCAVNAVVLSGFAFLSLNNFQQV